MGVTRTYEHAVIAHFLTDWFGAKSRRRTVTWAPSACNGQAELEGRGILWAGVHGPGEPML